MKNHLEKLAFVGVALAFHVAAFGQVSPSGSEAGGAGGDAFVTLTGSSPQIEQALAEWLKTPEVHQEVTPALDQIPTDQPPLPAWADLPPAPRVAAKIPVMSAAPQPDTPTVETAPASPPAPQPDALERTARPKQRPTPKPKPKAKPAEQTMQASGAVAAQKAAGSGGNPTAGSTSASPGLSKGQEQKLMAVWASKIRSRIERNKRVPRGLRNAGRVDMQIRIDRSGKLLSAKVMKSSGIADLDKLAVSSVHRAGRFAKAPKELPGQSHSFRFTLIYQR